MDLFNYILGFIWQSANSPNASAIAATQFLNAAASSNIIPPNITSSSSIQHTAAILNQQQQHIQQLNHARNFGIPVFFFNY